MVNKLVYLDIQKGCEPTEIKVVKNSKGEVESIKTRYMEGHRIDEDTFEMTFRYQTAFKKKTFKLNFGDFDSIATFLKVWQDAEPSWSDNDRKIVRGEKI